MQLKVNRRSGPYWRAVLEARWRIQSQEATELSRYCARRGASAAPGTVAAGIAAGLP